jgi:proprotein convertase subtilisin/kexin type 2
MVKAKQTMLLAICIAWLTKIYGDVPAQGQGAEAGPNMGASTTAAPNDPLFSDQWHLKNDGAFSGSKKGEDLNVTGAWNMGYTGKGINIVIVDDGVDYKHEDLDIDKANSKDFSGKNPDGIDATETSKPNRKRNGSHGTAVAGLAAAKGNNKIGVTGVAYAAKTINFNNSVKNDDISTNSSAIAGVGQPQFAHISNNSWGPADNGQIHDEAAKNIWRTYMDRATTAGRDGKGVVSIWAAGNGGYNFLATYQGYNNNHNIITVAALNHNGQRASYSSPGANVLVSAFGGEDCVTGNAQNQPKRATTTTDITAEPGYNSEQNDPDDYDPKDSNLNYTRCFNGTSAATPQVSGVVALVLEANPNLNWRDVRKILATTARKNDDDENRAGRLDGEKWRKNGKGYWINESYGFGSVDATKAVQAAKNYTGYLGKQITVAGQRSGLNMDIPDGTADMNDAAQKNVKFNATEAPAAYGKSVTDAIDIGNSGIDEIEYVELKVGIKHNDAGELKITLTSPDKTISTLARRHPCYYTSDGADQSEAWKKDDKMKSCGGVNSNYVFGIAQFMDEKADGPWTIEVADGEKYTSGSLDSWNITLYGHKKNQAKGDTP